MTMSRSESETSVAAVVGPTTDLTTAQQMGIMCSYLEGKKEKKKKEKYCNSSCRRGMADEQATIVHNHGKSQSILSCKGNQDTVDGTTPRLGCIKRDHAAAVARGRVHAGKSHSRTVGLRLTRRPTHTNLVASPVT